MKKELLISKMAILLFFCAVLFTATAQAQMCFEVNTETSCVNLPGCYWCATMVTCYPFPTCVTCDRLDQGTCRISPVCQWNEGAYRCISNTCGNNILEKWEQCDGGANCLATCTCPIVWYGNIGYAMVPDGNKGCTSCGNRALDSGEQCDGGRFCTSNCTCPEGYENDGGNGCRPIVQCFYYINQQQCSSAPGCYWCPTKEECQSSPNCPSCYALTYQECTSSICQWCDVSCNPIERPCTCGDNILDPGEQCEEFSQHCINCQCEPSYTPDPGNPGYCKATQVCGNNVLEGTEQCELYSRNCVDCVCVDGTVPDPVNVGFCIPTNWPPVLDPIGDKAVDEGVTLQFTVTATDPDNNALTFDTDTLPDGASFDTASQVFVWTPGYGQAGNYQVLFRVVDNGTPPLSASETITITVGNINRPPKLDPVEDKTVNEGKMLTFSITAADPDNDPLTYSASNLPPGAGFDNQVFGWTPDFTQAGNYTGVRFEVSDGSSTDFKEITITVGNINRPPKLDPIGNRTVNEGEKLEIVITATDPDGDRLTYSTSNLPAGATFDPIAQKFSWTPGYNQAGEYQLTFNVSDGEWSASETIGITVINLILQATIDINPDTLNLKSKGGENSMTAYIELPGGYDVRQISVASIKLNVSGKMISAQPVPTSIGDYDGDGFYDLMVKFDRQAVISALGGMTGQITMTVIGQLNNGPEFTGSDTIKVINPGK